MTGPTAERSYYIMPTVPMPTINAALMSTFPFGCFSYSFYLAVSSSIPLCFVNVFLFCFFFFSFYSYDSFLSVFASLGSFQHCSLNGSCVFVFRSNSLFFNIYFFLSFFFLFSLHFISKILNFHIPCTILGS